MDTYEHINSASGKVDDTYRNLVEYTEMFKRADNLPEEQAVEAAEKLCKLFAKWRRMK